MKKLIYGNWKMNLSAEESAGLAGALSDAEWPEELEVAVFPSFTALAAVRQAMGHEPRAKLGAQDCFWEEKGAYTGEVSPGQLAEFECSRVLIGHSERRRYLGETDAMVNRKMKAALSAGFTPVLCVGETDEDRRNGLWAEVIARQTTEGLKGLEVSGSREIVIAYEPIWAIGSGRPCDPTAAREAHALARNAAAELFGMASSEKNFRIIYGGSVDASNIVSYLAEEGIDGALVGGASQDAGTFLALLEAAKDL